MIKLTKILKEIVVKPTSVFKFNIEDKVELEGDESFPGTVIFREPNVNALKQALDDNKLYLDLYYDIYPHPRALNTTNSKNPLYVVQFHDTEGNPFEKIVPQEYLELAPSGELDEIVVKPTTVGTVVLLAPKVGKSFASKKKAREIAIDYLKDFQSKYKGDTKGLNDYSPQVVRWDTDLYSVWEYDADGELSTENMFIGAGSDLYDLALRQLEDPGDNEAMDEFGYALGFKSADDIYTMQDVNKML